MKIIKEIKLAEVTIKPGTIIHKMEGDSTLCQKHLKKSYTMHIDWKKVNCPKCIAKKKELK